MNDQQKREILDQFGKIETLIKDLEHAVYLKSDDISDNIASINKAFLELKTDHKRVTDVLLNRNRIPVSTLFVALGMISLIVVMALAAVLGLDVLLEKGDGAVSIKNSDILIESPQE